MSSHIDDQSFSNTQDLKSRLPILDFLAQQGVQAQKQGKSWMARCPFHDDSTASMSVDPEKNLWHCFGCQKGGDLFTFLRERDGLTHAQAVQAAQAMLGELPETRPAPSLARPAVPPGVDPYLLLDQVAAIYEEAFQRHRQARLLMSARGLKDPATLRAFRVGYCTGTALRERAGAGETRRALQALGVLNEKGRDSLAGCVTVPLRDTEGRVVGFYGRRLANTNPRHRLTGGRVQGFCCPEAVRGTSSLILVEGVLDAIACWQAGFRHVLALGGTALTSLHFQLIARSGVRQVWLALDDDEAGEEGAKAAARRLVGAGLSCYRVKLDIDNDPCAFFAAFGNTPEKFRELLLAAKPIGCRPAQAPTVPARQSEPESPAPPAPESLTAAEEPAPEPEEPEPGREPTQVAPAQAAPEEPSVEASGEDLILEHRGLTWKARLVSRPGGGQLKARLRLEAGGQVHRDLFNLYSSKARRTFANRAAERFSLDARLIEEQLEDLIERLELFQSGEPDDVPPPPEMSDEEREEALAYLKKNDLVEAILADMETLGAVGEEEAKLLAFLVGVSRKLARPLSGILLSGSGAGKSSVAELVEALTPPEEVVFYSRISATVLYYQPADFLRHKLLMLEERAGGEAADYSIRTLQSKRRLTLCVTVKDPQTGEMKPRTYEVEGPIAYLETTTNPYLNPENSSRCFEIPLDESAEQTRRIHAHQRAMRGQLERLARRVRSEALCKKHHNAQRLLEPMEVWIPYADRLRFPDRLLRNRRDHERFLCLIEAVAFLHQKQRVIHDLGEGLRCVEATVADYALAHRLALRVLDVAVDERSRWGRFLCEWLEGQLNGDPRSDRVWTRRELREGLSWPARRLHETLDELVHLEYVLQDRSPQGNLFFYRLGAPSRSAGPAGLLSPEELRAVLT
ncbi:toprim domain-containing protein [bacterium CPR1]|nr:toprim domain-containing protein [bacterium CPR1]